VQTGCIPTPARGKKQWHQNRGRDCAPPIPPPQPWPPLLGLQLPGRGVFVSPCGSRRSLLTFAADTMSAKWVQTSRVGGEGALPALSHLFSLQDNHSAGSAHLPHVPPCSLSPNASWWHRGEREGAETSHHRAARDSGFPPDLSPGADGTVALLLRFWLVLLLRGSVEVLKDRLQVLEGRSLLRLVSPAFQDDVVEFPRAHVRAGHAVAPLQVANHLGVGHP